jgi:glycerol kinase
MPYILALDQGTSSSRTVVYNQHAQPVAISQQAFTQYYPKPGWVEHDPEQIWLSQLATLRQALEQSQANPTEIAALGITNQRETTLIWERSSGKPIYNAIVWQDRRTAEDCNQLKQQGLAAMVQEKTGLLLDAYFSATKIRWLLNHIEGARQRAERGELAFGTVDTWLAWQLSNGSLHITDVSNAARTLLFNINTLQWDDELLSAFDIPAALMPTVVPSCQVYGYSAATITGTAIPIAAMAGDQQAGLFGQLCTQAGMAKCTYGTGCFLMMNTGTERLAVANGLLTTIAWQIGKHPYYAIEGSVFIGGAIIQWLRDGLGVLQQASESEALAASVVDNGGVYFVPALTGLGAPHWDPNARGAIFGITRGTTAAHITRAALESIAFQVEDVLQLFGQATGQAIRQLRVDGGAISNNQLAQFQADISQLELIRSSQLESTSLGIAYLAGLAVGLWSLNALQEKELVEQSFQASFTPDEVAAHKYYWLKAVARTQHWLE